MSFEIIDRLSVLNTVIVVVSMLVAKLHPGARVAAESRF